MSNLENPSFDEAPLAHLINVSLDNMSEEELRKENQRLREIRQVPQKRKAATSGKKARMMDTLSHLLDE